MATPLRLVYLVILQAPHMLEINLASSIQQSGHTYPSLPPPFFFFRYTLPELGWSRFAFRIVIVMKHSDGSKRLWSILMASHTC